MLKSVGNALDKTHLKIIKIQKHLMAASSGCRCRSTMMVCVECAVEIYKAGNFCDICENYPIEEPTPVVRCSRCNLRTCPNHRKKCKKSRQCEKLLCSQCYHVDCYCEIHRMKLTFHNLADAFIRKRCCGCKKVFKKITYTRFCDDCNNYYCSSCCSGFSDKDGRYVNICNTCKKK